MRNLDTLAAQTAQQIVADTRNCAAASEVDSLATKALGVLQENGVYACALFLYSRTGKEKDKIAPPMRRQLLALAAQEVLNRQSPPDQAEKALRFVSDDIASDLDTLLLVKQVWEQTLIYVRYGAKARG